MPAKIELGALQLLQLRRPRCRHAGMCICPAHRLLVSAASGPADEQRPGGKLRTHCPVQKEQDLQPSHHLPAAAKHARPQQLGCVCLGALGLGCCYPYVTLTSGMTSVSGVLGARLAHRAPRPRWRAREATSPSTLPCLSAARALRMCYSTPACRMWLSCVAVSGKEASLPAGGSDISGTVRERDTSILPDRMRSQGT